MLPETGLPAPCFPEANFQNVNSDSHGWLSPALGLLHIIWFGVEKKDLKIPCPLHTFVLLPMSVHIFKHTIHIASSRFSPWNKMGPNVSVACFQDYIPQWSQTASLWHRRETLRKFPLEAWRFRHVFVLEMIFWFIFVAVSEHIICLCTHCVWHPEAVQLCPWRENHVPFFQSIYLDWHVYLYWSGYFSINGLPLLLDLTPWGVMS